MHEAGCPIRPLAIKRRYSSMLMSYRPADPQGRHNSVHVQGSGFPPPQKAMDPNGALGTPSPHSDDADNGGATTCRQAPTVPLEEVAHCLQQRTAVTNTCPETKLWRTTSRSSMLLPSKHPQPMWVDAGPRGHARGQPPMRRRSAKGNSKQPPPPPTGR